MIKKLLFVTFVVGLTTNAVLAVTFDQLINAPALQLSEKDDIAGRLKQNGYAEYDAAMNLSAKFGKPEMKMMRAYEVDMILRGAIGQFCHCVEKAICDRAHADKDGILETLLQDYPKEVEKFKEMFKKEG